MKRLKPFEYREPNTLGEAIRILAGEGPRALPLAGGTDLLVRMKQGVLAPSLLVNLKRIAGLDRIERSAAGGTTIGALTTIAAVERSEPLRQDPPRSDPGRGTARFAFDPPSGDAGRQRGQGLAGRGHGSSPHRLEVPHHRGRTHREKGDSDRCVLQGTRIDRPGAGGDYHGDSPTRSGPGFGGGLPETRPPGGDGLRPGRGRGRTHPSAETTGLSKPDLPLPPADRSRFGL